jgi:hypothetical protein
MCRLTPLFATQPSTLTVRNVSFEVTSPSLTVKAGSQLLNFAASSLKVRRRDLTPLCCTWSEPIWRPPTSCLITSVLGSVVGGWFNRTATIGYIEDLAPFQTTKRKRAKDILRLQREIWGWRRQRTSLCVSMRSSTQTRRRPGTSWSKRASSRRERGFRDHRGGSAGPLLCNWTRRRRPKTIRPLMLQEKFGFTPNK